MRISQYIELPKKMQNARIKAGLTQSYLAQKLGISQQSYARYENGMTEPSIEALEIFCKEVHMTIPELLGLKEPDKEKINPFSNRYIREIQIEEEQKEYDIIIRVRNA